MSRAEKFKQLVRERMARTNENYHTARDKLLKVKLCAHTFIVQGANGEDLVCIDCGVTKVNDDR